MKKTLTIACVGLLLGSLTVRAQDTKAGSTAQADKPPTKPTSTVVTMVGCVQGSGSSEDPFRLLNGQEGVTYKLTGTNMRAFIGKRVQISGGPDPRRLKIVGGLTPSANVAAQAGALDPARAAVESSPLSTAGKSDPQLPEFRVRSVRAAEGSCEK